MTGISKVSEEDRAAIDDTLRRYGNAWESGLAGLAREFDVTVVSHQTGQPRPTYEIDLRSLAPPGMSFHLTLDGNGALSSKVPGLPSAPEATADQLARFDALLRREQKLWWVEPMNGYLVAADVSAGLAAFPGEDPAAKESRGRDRVDLRGMALFASRVVEKDVVLYFRDEPFGDQLCLCADATLSTFTGMYYADTMPPTMRKLHVLKAERAFFDRALREHGDFGVYGNVTAGLEWLLVDFDITIREGETCWEVSLDPRDGQGHCFGFEIEKETGDISSPRIGSS